MSAGWGQLIVDGLIAGGVIDAVICPGSRSAPITNAAASSTLRCHPVYDERSAAFFAMGLSRVSSRPTALVCTSGTAGAHFFPAIIEASLSGFPLVVITADRPPEDRAAGAPQTIDQVNLFGSHVRAFVDIACPSSSLDVQLKTWNQVLGAVATSQSRPIGPVHLNVPIRKPLLGTDISVPRFAVDDAVEHQPRCRASAPKEVLEAIGAAFAEATRPLFVCGPLNPDCRDSAAVAELAASLAIPVLAEATSQLRFGPRPTSLTCIDRGHHLLPAAFDSSHVLAPDLIVEFGATPTSSGYGQALISNQAIQRFCVRSERFQDPWKTAQAVFVTPIDAVCRDLQNRGPFANQEARAAYKSAWSEADAQASANIESLKGNRQDFSGQCAVENIVANLPRGSHILIGNSLAVRWLDAGSRSRPSASFSIHCQRGASGIDGLIAGAAGIARSAGAPTCLVLGDVSAAHDIGSLAVAAVQSSPLVICVLDNGGGQIFAELPYSSELEPSTLERFFTTPPSLDFTFAARSFGVRAIRAPTPALLRAAIKEGCSQNRATLIHIPIDRYSPPVLGYPGSTNSGKQR